MGQGNSDNVFKVSLINPKNHRRLFFTQRLSREIIVWRHRPIRTSCPYGCSNPSRHALLPHSHSVDAQRKYFAARKIQYRGKRLAVGEPARCFVMNSLLPTRNPQLSEVMLAMAYPHDLGVVHGDLKGVYPVFPRRSSSLTAEPGENPRRQCRRCSRCGIWAYDHGRFEHFPLRDYWIHPAGPIVG